MLWSVVQAQCPSVSAVGGCSSRQNLVGCSACQPVPCRAFSLSDASAQGDTAQPSDSFEGEGAVVVVAARAKQYNQNIGHGSSQAKYAE